MLYIKIQLLWLLEIYMVLNVRQIDVKVSVALIKKDLVFVKRGLSSSCDSAVQESL